MVDYLLHYQFMIVLCQLKRDQEELESKLAASKENVEEIETKLQPIQDRLKDISSKRQEIVNLNTQISEFL